MIKVILKILRTMSMMDTEIFGIQIDDVHCLHLQEDVYPPFLY